MPAALLLVLLLVMSKTPAPWPVLFVLLGLVCYISFQHLAEWAVYQRRLWLDLYLLPNSGWRSRLSKTKILRAVAALTAAMLTVATYLAIYAESALSIVSITAMLVVADFVCTRLNRQINDNLISAYAVITQRRLAASLAIAFVLVGLVATRFYESVSTDYSQETARSIARKTIDNVKHPVVVARHWTRTVQYYDLTLLRIRDTLGWPAGWIVYIAFLIPNAIPAAGAYSVYRGLDIILKRHEANRCIA
jgi:hypothetical protein